MERNRGNKLVRVVDINIDDSLLEKIDRLYQEVWKQSIKERLIKHLKYEGFRGYFILEEEGILGFCYGYSSHAGQYYHDLLSKELTTEEYKEWLHNCFEIVELVVHPFYRHQGYGKMLINELLKEVKNKTAVLTTQVNNVPARNLYKGLGWTLVKDDFTPTTSDSPYVIMGKVL